MIKSIKVPEATHREIKTVASQAGKTIVGFLELSLPVLKQLGLILASTDGNLPEDIKLSEPPKQEQKSQ